MTKITFYKFLLTVLILLAIILSALVIKKQVISHKVENEAQKVLTDIKKTQNEEEQGKKDVIKKIEKEVGGYKVIGIIKIPKINIEYPILEKTDEKSLNLSITKFWGSKINDIGNICLAGHNNFNNKMFGRINELKDGDIIELTDDQMVTVQYTVFEKKVIDPNDVSCVLPKDETRREVTLITCTKGAKARLIVRASEI